MRHGRAETIDVIGVRALVHAYGHEGALRVLEEIVPPGAYVPVPAPTPEDRPIRGLLYHCRHGHGFFRVTLDPLDRSSGGWFAQGNALHVCAGRFEPTETMLAALPGRRASDLVAHHLLDDAMTIGNVRIDEDGRHWTFGLSDAERDVDAVMRDLARGVTP